MAEAGRAAPLGDVFLDACVLFPELTRALALETAAAGLMRPLWSQRVIDEWRIAALRAQGLDGEAPVAPVLARLRALNPAGEVRADPRTEAGLQLPDPGDTHVLAAAMAAGAEVLLTFNLRDFPRRRLAGHGILPRDPDGFFWEALSRYPEAMGRAAEAALGAVAPDARAGALKRARLSRFARLWAGSR